MTFSNRAKFALVFVVINLHMVRNLFLVAYLSIYGLTVAAFRIAFLLVNRARLLGHPAVTTILFAYAIVMVNSFFANGTLYEPVSASVFYLALFVATTKILGPGPNLDGSRLSPLRHNSPLKLQ